MDQKIKIRHSYEHIQLQKKDKNMDKIVYQKAPAHPRLYGRCSKLGLMYDKVEQGPNDQVNINVHPYYPPHLSYDTQPSGKQYR